MRWKYQYFTKKSRFVVAFTISNTDLLTAEVVPTIRGLFQTEDSLDIGGGKSNEDRMGSHMGSVLVSPFPLEANGNRNGVMDGQNQIPNVAKVGSEGRRTGKHTETSLFSLISKGKGMAEGQSKEATMT